MPQTFQQLLATPTKEELFARLLGVLQGIGLTSHDGTGTGLVGGLGAPSSTRSVLVNIVATGGLGTATFRLSADGGSTWGTTRTVPANGRYAPTSGDPASLIGVGLTYVTFTAGPIGTDSFVAGDDYTFALSAPGFPTSSWQEGDASLTLVELDAEALEDLYKLQRAIAAGGILDEATGDWLTLLAKNVYQLDRTPGVVAEGVLTLSDPTNQGPFNLNNGDVWVISDDGHRYVLAQNVTVGLSGSVDGVVFRAEAKGSAYNVANNDISTLVTAVPGLVVNNPDPGSGSWLTTPGSNDETDEALRIRCRARWGELGIGLPGSNYELWARTASDVVTRVGTRVSPTVAGRVDVILAGASGAVAGGVVTAVQNYINPRVALTNTALVASCTNVPVTVAGTVSVQAAYLASATAAVAAALTALFLSKGVGGDTVYVSELIEAIMVPTGVVNVVLSSPTIDTVLAFGQAATLTNSLVFTAV